MVSFGSVRSFPAISYLKSTAHGSGPPLLIIFSISAFLHGHLFLHHLLLHSHRVLSYHNSDSLYKTKHGTSNQSILKSSLRSWSKCKHSTCHESTENSIEWVISLPVVEHEAINWTKATTPHCETTTDQRSSVSDMGYCSQKSLSSWCIPGA